MPWLTRLLLLASLGIASACASSHRRGDAREPADADASASAPEPADGGGSEPTELPDFAADPKLADVLDRTGVRAGRDRAERLFQATCARFVACGDVADEASCFDEHSRKWDAFLASDDDDDCLDAYLDGYSCNLVLECDDFTSCGQVARETIARCNEGAGKDSR